MSTEPIDPNEKRWRISALETREAHDPRAFEDLVQMAVRLEDERRALSPTVSLLTLRKSGLSRAEVATALMNLAAHIEAAK